MFGITAYGMKMMNGEEIRIVFSTGPYDYGDDELEDITIIDGLEKLTFDDIDELEDLTKKFIEESFNGREEPNE